MKITENVRKYAAEQGIAEEEALKKGLEEKLKEFVEKGAGVYANPLRIISMTEKPQHRKLRCFVQAHLVTMMAIAFTRSW